MIFILTNLLQLTNSTTDSYHHFQNWWLSARTEKPAFVHLCRKIMTCREKVLTKTWVIIFQFQIKLHFACVSQQWAFLATGFLTLQVQLPVLRPHLRRGITACYPSTNNSLCPPTCRRPDTGNRVGRCERCYINTWMCEQQTTNLLPGTDTLPEKLVCLLQLPSLSSTILTVSLCSCFTCFSALRFLSVFDVLFLCALNRAFISSCSFSAVWIEAVFTEPQPVSLIFFTVDSFTIT